MALFTGLECIVVRFVLLAETRRFAAFRTEVAPAKLPKIKLHEGDEAHSAQF